MRIARTATGFLLLLVASACGAAGITQPEGKTLEENTRETIPPRPMSPQYGGSLMGSGT